MDLVGILSTLMLGLIAAIGAMWKKLSADHAKLERRSEACESRDAAMSARVGLAEQKIAVFETCSSDNCGALAAFKRRRAFAAINEKTETSNTDQSPPLPS